MFFFFEFAVSGENLKNLMLAQFKWRAVKQAKVRSYVVPTRKLASKLGLTKWLQAKV